MKSPGAHLWACGGRERAGETRPFAKNPAGRDSPASGAEEERRSLLLAFEQSAGWGSSHAASEESVGCEPRGLRGVRKTRETQRGPGDRNLGSRQACGQKGAEVQFFMDSPPCLATAADRHQQELFAGSVSQRPDLFKGLHGWNS